ncbi:MAG: FtsL-like putative cell division protein [Bacteroidales bacterium]|nr:FtsL-like putative cell division protein [Bacteroidales bacterium]
MNKTKKITKKEIKASFRGIVNGSIVASDIVRKQIPFIIVIFILGLIYISNRFHAEKVFRETEETQKLIEDLRAEKIEIQSELMTISRRGEILTMLKEKGSNLEESSTPPKKISYHIDNE